MIPSKLIACAVGFLYFLVPTAAAQAPAPPAPPPLDSGHVALLADAIENTEGKCGPGESGEYGCYQYLPSTWRAYSTDIAGQVLTQTGENERFITESKIRTWVDAGISDRGIFLLWNQGSANGWGPGMKDCYAGVNDHGVAYDSCDYARRGLEYIKAHS